MELRRTTAAAIGEAQLLLARQAAQRWVEVALFCEDLLPSSLMKTCILHFAYKPWHQRKWLDARLEEVYLQWFLFGEVRPDSVVPRAISSSGSAVGGLEFIVQQ